MQKSYTQTTLVKDYEWSLVTLYELYLTSIDLLKYLDPEEEYDNLGNKAEILLKTIHDKYFPNSITVTDGISI